VIVVSLCRNLIVVSLCRNLIVVSLYHNLIVTLLRRTISAGGSRLLRRRRC
jgi:hypothetical protein